MSESSSHSPESQDVANLNVSDFSVDSERPARTPVADTAGTFRSDFAGYRTPIRERALGLIALDVACVLTASVVAFVAWYSFADHGFETISAAIADKWYWVPLAAVVWGAAAWIVDLYDVVLSGIGKVVAQRTLAAATFTTLFFLAGYFFSPTYIPRLFFLGFVCVVAGLSVIARRLHMKWIDRNPSRHRMLLIGDEASELELGGLLSRVPRVPIQLVGSVDTRMMQDLYAQDGAAGLVEFAFGQSVSEIVVADHRLPESEAAFRSLVECQANGISVSSMAEIYRKVSRQIPVEFVDSHWMLATMQDRMLFTRIQMTIKRGIDVIGALCAMPFLGLMIPPIALAIKLDTKGNVFYCQERTGRAGRKFRMVKFRTMVQNAEKDGKAKWADKNDSRITRVGAFLRATRLDEFPQFINVLRGEMSLVGPRPEREQIEVELDRALPHYFLRRLVKPGITGWAQVHYKYGNTIEDSRIKLQYDAYYVRYWSLITDFYVLVRTIGVMIGMRGQ